MHLTFQQIQGPSPIHTHGVYHCVTWTIIPIDILYKLYLVFPRDVTIQRTYPCNYLGGCCTIRNFDRLSPALWWDSLELVSLVLGISKSRGSKHLVEKMMTSDGLFT